MTPPTGKDRACDWKGLETERQLLIKFEDIDRYAFFRFSGSQAGTEFMCGTKNGYIMHMTIFKIESFSAKIEYYYCEWHPSVRSHCNF